MKLTVLKSIARDLLGHIDSLVWFGDNQIFKNIPNKIDTNILEQKDDFDKYCFEFFKKRIPKSFDIKRVDEIKLVGSRGIDSFKMSINIKIEDKVFTENIMGFKS